VDSHSVIRFRDRLTVFVENPDVHLTGQGAVHGAPANVQVAVGDIGHRKL
jgi:hypothetical protein